MNKSMNNGKLSSGAGRKEPQLNAMTHLDPMRDEAFRPVVGDILSTVSQEKGASKGSDDAVSSAYSASNTAATAASGGSSVVGIWIVLLFVIVSLAGVSGYMYLELDRVNGMQRLLLERVNALAAESDQLDTKLSASGGQLEQTQTSINARVIVLEQKVFEQLSLVENIAKQGKTLALDVKDQLAVRMEKQMEQQTEALNAVSETILADIQNIQKKALAEMNVKDLEQTRVLQSLQQAMTKAEKDIAQVATALQREKNGFNQSLQLLKEELAIDPARLKTLQDQFTTYMQSMDQFRQQTNGSLNDLNLQIQEAYRQVQPFESVTEDSMNEPNDFGVQPVR